MKRTLCAVISFLLLLSLFPSTYAVGENFISFSDDPKAIQAASNSVVMLSCYDKDGNLFATGSAFAAFEEGTFVTNFHVIEGAYSIRAQMESGLEFRLSSVIAYDTEKDIAILHTEAKTGLDPLPLGDSSELERAEKVIAIGSPLGLINTISVGLYSGTVKDERVYLQFSAPISEGSSGGALFNNRGEVVGITSASYTRGQNLNLAIPIEDVKTLYEEAGRETQISVEALYDSAKHILSNQTYSVADLLKHFKELDGQSIYLEGYVSSAYLSWEYGNGTLDIYIVDNNSDILGYEGSYIGPEELFRCVNGKSINIKYRDQNMLRNIHPYDKVSVYCSVISKNDGKSFSVEPIEIAVI